MIDHWQDFGRTLVGLWLEIGRTSVELCWDFSGTLLGFWRDFAGILVGLSWDFDGTLWDFGRFMYTQKVFRTNSFV